VRAPEASPRRSLGGALEVALAASLWGCWSLFLRPSGLPALATAPATFIVTGLILLPLAWRERPRPAWTRATLVLLVAYSAIDSVNILAFFAAMEQTTIAVAVLTHYTMPLIVALLAPLVERERVRGALLAALVATIGLVPVVGLGRGPSSARALLGALLGLLSACAYASAVFLARRVMARVGVLRALAYHVLLGGVLMMPALPFGRVVARPAATLLWVLLGMLVLGAGAGILFMHGLARVGATRASILTYLEPLVAVAVAWVAWSERLSPAAIVGGLLILTAGIWISQARSVS